MIHLSAQIYIRSLILLGVSLLCGCDTDVDKLPPYVEVTEISGLDFKHVNGMSGQFYLPEIMAGGVALLDYDADGDLDVYLVQSGQLSERAAGDLRVTDQLFRNVSYGSSIRFENVSAQALVQSGSYAMGVAVGDVNNDGYPDLYVTAFDDNRLLLNDGQGSFVDITGISGSGSQRWSVSAAFVDVNMDGLLDLYVGNYIDYSLVDESQCRSLTSAPDYCDAKRFRAQADQLFMHQGINPEGYPVYKDQSSEYGIADWPGRTLSVASADINNDSWPDIIATGNASRNLVWINDQGKRFDESAQISGMAYDLTGQVLSSHGLDIADYDHDGDLDVFVTHTSGQANSLYTQHGNLAYIDKGAQLAVANSSYNTTGFGIAFVEINGDNLLDLFIANGGVSHIQSQIDAGDEFPLREANQLLLNTGHTFIDVSDTASKTLQDARVSRGIASGDLDNDGDLELVIANNNSQAQILNNTLDPQSWTGVVPRLAGTRRVALEARVDCSSFGTRVVNRVRRSGSYASSSDPRVRCFPVMADDKEKKVTIIWPDGMLESFSELTSGVYNDLIQGSGVVIPTPEIADAQ